MATLVPTLDELATEFGRLMSDYVAKAAAADAHPEDKAADTAADQACAQLCVICVQIGRLRAQNAQHVATKARALLWYDFSGGVPASGDTSELLAYQVAFAVVHGAPA